MGESSGVGRSFVADALTFWHIVLFSKVSCVPCHRLLELSHPEHQLPTSSFLQSYTELRRMPFHLADSRGWA
jgi:hypothetical protein